MLLNLYIVWTQFCANFSEKLNYFESRNEAMGMKDTDLGCVKTIISLFLTIQTHLTIQISN